MGSFQIRKVGCVRDPEVELRRGAGALVAALEVGLLGPDIKERRQ